MANLLEAYKTRLAVADKVYGEMNEGKTMSQARKILVAQMLKNTTNYLNESLANSFGTQRGDLGAFRKFTINLVNIATPTLVAPDLVMVHPMDSVAGYVAYMSYTYGSNKGNVQQGDVFNTPFALDPDKKVNGLYTSSKVLTNSAFTSGQVGGTDPIALDWSPVTPGTVLLVVDRAGTTKYYADVERNGNLYALTGKPSVTEIIGDKANFKRYLTGTIDTSAGTSGVCGTIVYGTTNDGRSILGNKDTGYLPVNAGHQAVSTNPLKGSITLATSVFTASDEFELSYVYDNAYVPQNDVPVLNGEMKGITLEAKPHRIQIYFSNLAAFQSKTEYGFDLGDNLAKQAVAQLQYDMDTVVVEGLSEAAGTEDASLVWSKTLPIGVSKMEHYAGFSEVIELGKQIIYDRTGKFAPNYMVVASSVMPILAFVPGFKSANTTNINGPYFAGTLNGLKVYVSPKLTNGRYFFGVNGTDAYTSAAILGIYLPAMPTMLLTGPDGGTAQGFSSMYDFEILNDKLLVAGRVTN